KEAGLADSQADRLLLGALEFKLADHALEFRAGGKDWRCDLKSYAVTELKGREQSATSARSLRATTARTSRTTGPETEVTFVNRTSGAIEIFWLNPQGERRTYGTI